MSTKTIKARLMWADPHSLLGKRGYPPSIGHEKLWERNCPVAMIPLDDIEALIEQLAKAEWRANYKAPSWEDANQHDRVRRRKNVVAILRSLGTPTKRVEPAPVKRRKRK